MVDRNLHYHEDRLIQLLKVRHTELSYPSATCRNLIDFHTKKKVRYMIHNVQREKLTKLRSKKEKQFSQSVETFQRQEMFTLDS